MLGCSRIPTDGRSPPVCGHERRSYRFTSITGTIVLLVGAPGSGKTMMAQQTVFANATPEHPALYLTTVSEPLEKILR